MKRFFIEKLEKWFNKANRKPWVPIEAKAEQNLRAKSLKNYRAKWSPLFAVRTSLSGMREDNGLKNIPLYAIGGKNVWKTEEAGL